MRKQASDFRAMGMTANYTVEKGQPHRLETLAGPNAGRLFDLFVLKVMVDPSSPPSVRVRAADSVLDHAKQAIEIEDVEVRVAALEQAAELAKPSERSR